MRNARGGRTGEPQDKPIQYRVIGTRKEAPDTRTLRLQPTKGALPRPFAPGQFNMLYVFGVGEAPISMSGDPEDPGTLVHTVREVGAVTRALCRARAGDAIGVRGPFGTSWPLEDSEGNDLLFIAGGLGLPPLRPAIYRVLAERDRYGHVSILYGARTPSDILFKREMGRWSGRFDVDVHVTVDVAGGGWRGDVGVVTRLLKRAGFDPDHTTAFLCGPEVMFRFAAVELEDLGVRPEQVFVSMERNMHCGVGLCGHCQFGPTFVCKDGPVYRYDRVSHLLNLREV